MLLELSAEVLSQIAESLPVNRMNISISDSATFEFTIN